MAFWGVEVKPGKPYTHQYGSEHGRLHVSQATLGSGSSIKKSIVQCNVGDKKPIYLCSLLPERLETCQLNLEFEEDDEVTFSVIGPHSVHLSGFFYGENEDNLEDDYPLDSDEVDISETESESDDSMDYDSEDEDEDDFIDDDLDMYPPSHVPNSGVKIEEIVDEEKPASENDKSKRHKKMKSQLNKSDESKISGGLIIVKAGGSHPVLESEDEDGFPISSPHKTEALQRSEDKKDGRASEKVPKKQTGNDSEHHKNLKRKIVAVSEDGEHARKTGQQSDSLLQSVDAVPENDAKQKKKNKKKKVVREEEIAPDTKSDMDQVKAAEMENGQKPIDEKEKEKKKKKNKKKNKKQESTSDSKAEQSVTAKKGSTETETKPSQVRSFPNGLVVEELAMGKPDGKRASNGKKVSVRYIGKLKNNGKIFDSNIGRAPFKFRLGVGQVIKGWDVGVNGMRVGDKRRLTIPPSMGYGKKGAGGAIPPNAWLVFDVELVDVN